MAAGSVQCAFARRDKAPTPGRVCQGYDYEATEGCSPVCRGFRWRCSGHKQPEEIMASQNEEAERVRTEAALEIHHQMSNE